MQITKLRLTKLQALGAQEINRKSAAILNFRSFIFVATLVSKRNTEDFML